MDWLVDLIALSTLVDEEIAASTCRTDELAAVSRQNAEDRGGATKAYDSMASSLQVMTDMIEFNGPGSAQCAQ